MSRSYKRNSSYDNLRKFRRVSRAVGKKKARIAFKNINDSDFEANYKLATRMSFAYHPAKELEEQSHENDSD
jgi:hypothetical protein